MRERTQFVISLLGIVPSLAMAACGAEATGPAEALGLQAGALTCAPPAPVDPRRSLAVTDLNIVNNARFSLNRVMTQLVRTAGAGNTPLDAYRRIFDPNNRSPGFVSGGQHCTDQLDPGGHPAINNFEIDCARQEGVLAGPGRDPFCTGPGCDPYLPIALFNRFDLAPSDGANCGQYRIIYGKRSEAAAPPPGNRNLIIFEAVLPNPNPGCGLAACRPVAQFWADLSAVADPATRAQRLESFYFNGLPGFAPAIHAAHFTEQSGQIRANQFMNVIAGQGWQLREYRLAPPPVAGGPLGANLVTVKSNPFAELFNPASTRPEAVAFQDPANPGGFVAQVRNLAINDINGFFLSTDASFNGGESTSQPAPAPQTHDSDYPFWFGPGPSPFGAAIRDQLVSIGSPLTPRNIIDRAEAMSCAGCHQLSNNRDLGGGLIWPPSLGFTQVSEIQTEMCNGGPCWLISPALRTVFLPARKQKIETFLAGTACDACTAPAAGPGTRVQHLQSAPASRVH